MREIKFRAWNKVIKKWAFGGVFLDGGLDDRDLFLKARTGVEIMQYTGLHDKNGKDIYEGDRIHRIRDGVIGTVIWESPCFCVRYDPPVQDWTEWPSEYFDGIEVIGNIYEKKE